MAEAFGVDRQLDEGGLIVEQRFNAFLSNFTINVEDTANPERAYIQQIDSMVETDATTLYVDFSQLARHDRELSDAIEMEYHRFEPYLCQAIQNLAEILHPEAFVDENLKREKKTEYFVSFYNMPRIDRIRSLRTSNVGKLVSVSGTVTRTSDVRPELLRGTFICSACGLSVENVEQQYVFTEPQRCLNPKCANILSWDLDVARSKFVDWQRLRVQENADEIPAGNMPRNIDAILRHEVVERVKAGDRIVLTGMLLVLPDKSALSRLGNSAMVSKQRSGGRTLDDTGGVTGLEKLGVKEMTYRTAFLASSALPAMGGRGETNIRDDPDADPRAAGLGLGDTISDEEKEEIEKMGKTPNLYHTLCASIAPSVFSHLEVKRGVLLMLFGGVHKCTPDGIKLRGDINVCIVGDPSTAKSQFLKYVHSFLPKAIFASGKASSAAGLTASVLRDHETGEFCIEAGALMLADNGICCIDEFDKMDEFDQVAIHEAMEQQTISISKAGIQATLNARTAILAAANPLYGRYDTTKTLRANVQISAPIMSRFDLFFVVLDECDEAMDFNVAQHIIRVHQNQDSAVLDPPFSKIQMQKYIRYARRINPIIEEEGQKTVVECYKALRQNDSLGRNRSAYRITVRQLESLIRLSEALARLHLDNVVRPKYIREAYRLLRISIIHVDSEDIMLEDDPEISMNNISNEYGTIVNNHEHSTEGAQNQLPTMEQSPPVSPENPTNSPSSNTENVPNEAKVEAEKPVRQKRIRQLSYETYKKISGALVECLSRAETRGEGDIKWSDVVDWYCEEHEDDISGAHDIADRRKLINQVIKHMLTKESIAVCTRTATNQEEQYIALHPNYMIDQ